MTMSPFIRRYRAGALLLTLLVACSDPSGPEEVEQITELPRSLSVAETEVIGRSNDFGVGLLQEVLAEDERDNVILSPLSASMALGMTLNGADGGTFDAMRDGLAFDGLEQDEINQAYRDLIELLTTLDPTVRFDIANSVWARSGVPFHQSFFDAVTESFDATTESLDFADPAAVETINGWVDTKTNGFIERIVDQLDPALVMLLINAIYFDGTWTTAFDPADTRRQSFQRPDGSTVSVDMMTIAEVKLGLGFGAVDGRGYQAVELPYGGQAFSMLIVVPNEDVRGFVGALDPDELTGIIDGLSETEVDGVSIPKFELTYDAYLNDPLKRMGMDVAFTPAADFTRLSPIGDDLCIGFVRQKTFMEVDEVGTRAAAVTAVGIGVVSFTGLIADRPFMLALRERLSGTLIFVGVVGDPTAQDPGPQPFVNTCF